MKREDRLPVSLLLAGSFVVSPLALAEPRTGAQVYECTCIVCHGSGYLGAPKHGDAKRWSKLINEGLDDLVPMALKGIRAMPAKGGNPNLSDLEVARAVVYMTNAAGGGFPEPTETQVRQWRAKADQVAQRARPPAPVKAAH